MRADDHHEAILIRHGGSGRRVLSELTDISDAALARCAVETHRQTLLKLTYAAMPPVATRNSRLDHAPATCSNENTGPGSPNSPAIAKTLTN